MSNIPRKILIIQTAFIGDVILATPLPEALAQLFPQCEIHFMLRKGNEGLLENNPHISKVLIWNKKDGKYRSLYTLLKQIRREQYDCIINLQRFGATGLLTALSGAPIKIGFDKNPFSFSYTYKGTHEISNGKHEVERNLSLVSGLIPKVSGSIQPQTLHIKPSLYPSQADYSTVQYYKAEPYICIAPTSVWFTKQYPKEKWIELIKALNDTYQIYLLGAASDKEACDEIIHASQVKRIENLCGKLNFLESAALMRDAVMNYVNDSSPMHIASAMNANTTAIFCSTIPEFGFGPLSDNSKVVQIKTELYCRPCGLHGYKACPQGHFKCAYEIETNDLLF